MMDSRNIHSTAVHHAYAELNQLRRIQLGALYWMLLEEAFPARRGAFLNRLLLTLIGVPSGNDNRRPLRPRLDQG